MHRLAALPHIDLPDDATFLQWLDKEGLTEDVANVVTNLRRYFKDEAIRVERNPDPDSPDVVMVKVDGGPVSGPDIASETFTRFGEEWHFHQPIDLIVRVSVHLE